MIPTATALLVRRTAASAGVRVTVRANPCQSIRHPSVVGLALGFDPHRRAGCLR